MTERKSPKTSYSIGMGEALLNNTAVALAQTAVGLSLLSQLRGDTPLGRSEAIKEARNWLAEARDLLGLDIGVLVSKADEE